MIWIIETIKGSVRVLCSVEARMQGKYWRVQMENRFRLTMLVRIGLGRAQYLLIHWRRLETQAQDLCRWINFLNMRIRRAAGHSRLEIICMRHTATEVWVTRTLWCRVLLLMLSCVEVRIWKTYTRLQVSHPVHLCSRLIVCLCIVLELIHMRINTNTKVNLVYSMFTA